MQFNLLLGGKYKKKLQKWDNWRWRLNVSSHEGIWLSENVLTGHIVSFVNFTTHT
jgi:hypothetical protein